MSDKIEFTLDGKQISIYPGPENSPAVYVNSFTGDCESVRELLTGAPDHSLIIVSRIDWGKELSPWKCDPVMKRGVAFGGGADDYIKWMEEKLIPEAEGKLSGAPEWRGLAGYSLAGLFALYSLYRTDRFTRAVSASGSLWFPGFVEYAKTHEMKARPQCIYLSVGDREARTRNPVLSTVQSSTEALCDYFIQRGIRAEYELNPGNHFRDNALRTAKGIRWILGCG